MVTGAAATAIVLEDVANGAFDANPYICRVIVNKCAELTGPQDFYEDVDIDHLERVFTLHFVKVWVDYILLLDHLQSSLSECFRSPTFAKRQLQLRKTQVQSLGSNAAAEITSQG